MSQGTFAMLFHSRGVFVRRDIPEEECRTRRAPSAGLIRFPSQTIYLSASDSPFPIPFHMPPAQGKQPGKASLRSMGTAVHD